MVETEVVSSLLELLIGVVAVLIGTLTWRYRHRPGGTPLIVLCIGAAGYALASGLNVLLSAEPVVYVVHNLTYPFGMLVVAAVVLIALEVTERAKYRRHPIVFALAALVIFDLSISVTDPIHNLYITQPVFTETGVFVRDAANTGALFWVRAIALFAIVFLAAGLLIAELLRSQGTFRTQLTAIVSAYMVGLLFFVWQTFFPPYAAFDIATAGLLGGSLLIFWSLFYGGFLETVPIARETLIEEMDDPVIAVDAQYQVLDLNSAATSFFHLDTTALGAPVTEVFSDTPELISNIEQGASGRLELNTRLDGRCHFNVQSSPINVGNDGSNEFLGRVVVLREITEQVENERDLQRFKHAVEATGHAVFITDVDGVITYVNPAFEDITGYDRSEAVGETPRILKSGEMSESYYADLWSTILAGERWNQPVINRTADGDICHVEQTIAPITEGDDVVSFVAVQADVTARLRREFELERINQKLDEFASVVSHDLRNPLNVAAGRVALARKTEDIDHLDDAADAHERMETLIDRMLVLARSGNSLGTTEPVAIAEIASECWEMVGGIDATLEINEPLKTTVEGDPFRLKQLFENLYRNAIEHGGGDVSITVGPLPNGFYVEDDGTGIPEPDRELVFNVGHTTSQGGTGFGLSIVKEIATAHNWSVAVTEGTGGGARFEFTDIGATA